MTLMDSNPLKFVISTRGVEYEEINPTRKDHQLTVTGILFLNCLCLADNAGV